MPISLKDPFNYAGVASTLGLISYLDRSVAETNTPLIDILLELGAILYCKTNIPQSMMTGDSDNSVFGKVLNPHKLSLGAGGSSGGEGALVAMRGSILGVGTDIGGSIRIPALCCGTYGFKPSANRIPYGGQAFCTRRGSPGFPAAAGPLANSYEDLAFFVQNVIDATPWNRDATAIPFPWRHEVANSTPRVLRIGYFLQDPDIKVNPPVARALETSASKLSTAGFDIIPLKSLPSLETALNLVCDSFSLENSKQVFKRIEAGGEPIIKSLVKTMHTVNKKPQGYTVEEIFDLNVAKSKYKAAWNKVFVENQLDVILCPGAAHTAVPHDEYGTPPYTALWNLLEVSCMYVASFTVLT